MSEPTEWPDFSSRELGCRCGECDLDWTYMDYELMEFVQNLRTELGVPFPVTSGVRCKMHDARFGGHRAHTLNKDTTAAHAIDIQVHGKTQLIILERALSTEIIKGIGIKAHGAHDGRFIHLDTNPSRNEQVLWTYGK